MPSGLIVSDLLTFKVVSGLMVSDLLVNFWSVAC